MALTPLDIHNKEFKKTVFKGYDIDEVDEFLDQVIRDFESLIKDNAHLREQVSALQGRLEQYTQLEETLNKTLVVAQNSADELRVSARKEADLILQEARLQAERLVEQGQTKARKIVSEHEELLRHTAALRSQMKSTLKAQLELLDQNQPDVAGNLARTDAANAFVRNEAAAALMRPDSHRQEE